MDKSELKRIAQSMVANGKGILAADESNGTIKKRFDNINLEANEDARRDWRELLFCSTDAMKNYISGVILYDETIRQKANDGTALTQIIQNAGSIVGIKVDQGAQKMAGHQGETVTEGLDGLRQRLENYHNLGARFAKWRAVITIKDNILPSNACIQANTHALARYAALCQEQGIVPIVEPEVLMDGTHTAQRCFDVTCAVLTSLYEQLRLLGVYLEGTILKPNMIVSGTECKTQANIEEVASLTIDCFRKSVPEAVAGIVFLSGGQSDKLATAHLNAINKLGQLPWHLSFSYGRALQASPLHVWGGKTENIAKAQQKFTHRSKMNSLASLGKWEDTLEV